MDSVLLITKEENNFARFLGKIGYEVVVPNDEIPLSKLIHEKALDIIVLDAEFEHDALEVCDLLRRTEFTKETPLLLMSNSNDLISDLKDRDFDKIEYLDQNVTIGGLASRIATSLRLRKISGAKNLNASLAEANASLRDLNAHFNKELMQARKIQEGLLPKKLPQSDKFEISVSYLPLEQVGGDWYFVTELPDGKISVQVADVTGHGLAAAFIGCMTKLALSAAKTHEPAELLKAANALMTPQLPAGTFVTMVSFLYDPASGVVQFVRAGHPPGLMLRSSTKEIVRLNSDGFALGFFEDAEYVVENARLQKGDVLVVITDGLTEGQDRSNAQYGFEGINNVLINSAPDASAEQIKKNILADFKKFCDGRILKDDVTLIVIKHM